jgi:hypothetical protein
MVRRLYLSPFVLVALAATAAAQSPGPRFRWQPGLTLDYRVEQTTTVTDSVDGKTETHLTKLNLSKRWQVQSVDAAGVATLQLTLLGLRMEMGRDGTVPIVFDSQKVDPANAELNKDLLQYIGKPIATLRLDAQGQLVEVKESHFGPASRYAAELPFRVILPDVAPQVGQAWERTYQVKLEPPQGAGETYNAVQRYTCKSVTGAGLTIGLATTINDQPEAPADRIPLAPLLAEGTVVFDAANGRMKRADLKMAGEFAEHRGSGSKYNYTSTYVEELIEKQ